jgi:hypothetical protein
MMQFYGHYCVQGHLLLLFDQPPLIDLPQKYLTIPFSFSLYFLLSASPSLVLRARFWREQASETLHAEGPARIAGNQIFEERFHATACLLPE